MPIFSISFCCTRPVEWAMAFGGVLIGRHIAADAAIAIPIIMTVEPPPPSESLMPLHTVAIIGMSNAAVAVFDMKFESA